MDPTLALAAALLAGTGLGCLTGLVPGLHPNTLAALLAAAPLLGAGPGAVLLVSAAVAHTFLNVVPALVLGVPDPDVALSMLPGHDLVRRGEGEDAVLHSAAGSLAGLVLALAAVPLIPLLHAGAGALLAGLAGTAAPGGAVLGSGATAWTGVGPWPAVLLVGLSALTCLLVAQEPGRVPVHRVLVPAFDGVVRPDREPVGLGRVSSPSVRIEGVVVERDADGAGFVLEVQGGRAEAPDVGRSRRRRVRVEDLHGWADEPAVGDRVAVFGDLRWRPGPASRAAAVAVASATFLGAGLLGLAAGRLSYHGALGAAGPLLPLLAGLFGGATLLLTAQGAAVPDPLPGVGPGDRAAVRWALPGLAAAGLVAALPTVTAAQGAAVATLGGARDPKRWLVTLSAVNTAAAVLALAMLTAFDRVRSGVAAGLAVLPVLPAPGLLFASALAAGAVGYAVTVTVGRRAVAHAALLAGRRTAAVVLAGTALLVWALTGWTGLVLFGVASVAGTVPPRLGVRRVHLMGALVVPLLSSLVQAPALF